MPVLPRAPEAHTMRSTPAGIVTDASVVKMLGASEVSESVRSAWLSTEPREIVTEVESPMPIATGSGVIVIVGALTVIIFVAVFG